MWPRGAVAAGLRVRPLPRHILTLNVNLSSECYQITTLPGASISLRRQVASLQMSVWMPLLICPWQAASCPSLMEGDSHKRSCYEANRNPSFPNKRGHGSEPQWGSLLLCSHGQELPRHWEKANFPFSSRVKAETGKWRRRRHKQQPNKIFFQELLKQGRLWKKETRDCKSFSAGETGWRTSERDFFLFFLRIYS